MNKKITSMVLAATLLLSGTAVGSFTTQAKTVDDNAVSAAVSESSSTGASLASSSQEGVILHCFNWKLSDIEAALPEIAAAGFTSVQTSPVQPYDSQGAWYWAYLPTDFTVGTNDIGGKDDLISLCNAADKYGVKVIVDVVANHLTGDHNRIPSTLRDSQYWHNTNYSSQPVPSGMVEIDWSNRYQVTHGDIGMADLATENSYVQSVVKNYIQELKNCGVDGMRWDAAKHIGLPSEGDNFWATVVDNSLYNYGEILDNPGGDYLTVLNEYTKYISITDSGYSWNVREAFGNGSVPTSSGNMSDSGVNASKLVYWGESHDNYSNEADNGSYKQSQNTIDRAYALCAARANATTLYFSRPSGTTKETIKIGQKGSTHFTSNEVSAVNKFHNAMVGKADYYVYDTSSNVCAVTRKDGGAVIVKGSGSGNVSVSNGGGYVPAGTYVDQVSGNTFTVTSSTISGNIGSSGIAVIYDANEGPTASVTPGSSTYKTDTLTLTLKYDNATSGQYSVDGGAYTSFTSGQTITIGSGAAYGTKTTVSVKASDGTTTSDATTYTYTKVDPNATQSVYFDNSSYNWSSVYAYIYSASGSSVNENAAWPGVQMTKDSSGYFTLDVPEELANGYVIFTESSSATTNRYPADGEDGLSLAGRTMLFGANHSWTEYAAQQTTTATTATTATVATTPVGNVLIGDVNFDGEVTIDDATEIQRYLASIIVPENVDFAVAADTDGDGDVTILDVTTIQYYLIGNTAKQGKTGQYTGQQTTTVPVTTPTTTAPVTQPVTTPSDTYTIKLTNNYSWSTVSCYYWSDSNTEMTSWPGVAMTLDSTNEYGQDVYKVSIPSSATHIIFNNGNNGQQTVDIDVTGSTNYYISGGSGTGCTVATWTDSGSGSGSGTDTTQPATQPTTTQPATTPSSDTYTIKLTNNYSWSTVSCYYWSDSNTTMTSWPGASMTYDSTNDYGQDIYTISIPSSATHIIFNNGNNGQQTVDIDVTGSANYYISGGSGSSCTVATW